MDTLFCGSGDGTRGGRGGQTAGTLHIRDPYRSLYVTALTLHFSQTAQINPLRGFDRLASVGFSREDIDNFRQQFHSQSSANYLDLDFATEEECMSLYLPLSNIALTVSSPSILLDDEHARALEEQWIDNMDGGSSSVLASSSSSSSSVLQGVLLGFFFPLIPFFFLRSRKPAVFWENNAEAEVPSNVIFP